VRTAYLLYRRETQAWFRGAANHLMGAAFLALTGIGFWALAATAPGKGLLTSEVTFGSLLFWMAVVGTASVCSARLLGEERDSGTLELLLTAPVREEEVVLAKFAAGVTWVVFLCLPAMSYPWLLRAINPGWRGVDPGMWAAGVLMVLLATSLLTAAGMLFSQLLRRTMAAAAATFVAGILLVFRGSLRNWIGEGGAAGIDSLVPMSSHVAGFAAGLVDSRIVVFYLLGIGLLLFLNVRLLVLARYRRPSGVVNMAVTFVLAGLLVVLVNDVSLRHSVRADWSTSGGGPLTERTVRMLSSVRAPVKVTLLASAGERSVPSVRRLLDQSREACPLMQTRYVDPDSDLGMARDLARQFNLMESAVLVVECGSRWKALPLSAFSAKGGGASPFGRRGAVFVAGLEQGLSAAVYALSHNALPVVYFLSGHGERSVEDFSEHRGYAEIAGEIRDSVADVRTLTLDAATGVSNDCSVLVVAGPQRELPAWEAGRIREYLGRGGRLMALLDSGAETGLEGLLKEWGVKVGLDKVVDPRAGHGAPRDRWPSGVAGVGEVLVTHYGSHAVAAGLEGVVTVLTSPRSVEPLASGVAGGNLADTMDRPRVVPLAGTSRQSWAESDLSQQPPQFNEGYDRSGPVTVAVGVEKGAPSAIKMDIKPVRLAVFGDSQFAANGDLVGGNRRFFMNALEWLLDQERPAKTATDERGIFDLRMAPDRHWAAFAMIVAAPPALLACLAAWVALARRDRRTVAAPVRKEGRDA
jgi:ABC-type transport system involved in multi-copper enzyme maturation permease subunit